MGAAIRVFSIIVLLGMVVGCSRPSVQDTLRCQGLSAGSRVLTECLAENGHKQSQFDLGLEAYVYGEFNDAIHWFTLAEQDGMPTKTVDYERIDNFYLYPNQPGIKDAGIFLSQIYEKGLGVPQDKVRARRHHYFSSTIELEVISINAEEYMIVQRSAQNAEEKTFIVRKRPTS